MLQVKEMHETNMNIKSTIIKVYIYIFPYV